MERLIYSSSSSPSSPSSSLPQILRHHSAPFLPRLGCSYSPKSGFPPPTRLNLICCQNENPPSSSSISSQSLNKLPSLFSSPIGSSEETFSPSRLPRHIDVGSSGQQKALPVGTFVLLSALIVSLIHPLFPFPAFATLQSAAKSGAPAVGKRFLRTELLSSAWTGFFAGCLHTLSGPDHLAALAPLSIGRTRMESAAVGALWGCGHDAGQVIFGLIFLLLKDRLHIEIIRTWGTRVVGFTLLVIGAMGIKEASEIPTPCVTLENGECDVSIYETLKTPTIKKKKIGFATFATGIVHGLQPDALMMVLPALALPSRMAGAAFLVMFLVGTVVAMGCYTVFIGSCSEALKEKVPRITEKLTWVSSIVAIGLGSAIIISQLFGYSLY